MNVISKVILSIVVTGTILFCGFIATLFAAFTFSDVFYVNSVMFVAVIINIFIILKIWNLFKLKTRHIMFGATVVIMILTVVGFEINRSFENSFDTINEQSVNLSLYEPFRENTLAVSLNEPSTLSMAENLPKIDGATALYPLYAAFAKATYPKDYNLDMNGSEDVEAGTFIPEKVDDIIACTNTSNAYRRLINGETDIVFAAGPSEEQLQMADEAGVELRFTPIGREAFIFFVNSKNPVNNLSIDDIRKIYSGKETSWKVFGGKNTAIRAFQRPANSGSQTALIKIMGDVPIMEPLKEDVMGGMGEIISGVSSYRNYDNSIGYSFSFFATEMVKDSKIKLLSLNEVAPTRENIANKTYPFSDEFFAVTAGTKNPNADKFIEWILSEQGQYLVDKTGYTPLLSVEESNEGKIVK